MSAVDILAAFEREPEDLEFILPGFISGTVGLLTSPGATGKSFFALQSAMGICGLGAGTLGINLEKHGKVLYLCLEDIIDVLVRRLHAIGKHLSLPARQIVAANLRLECLMGRGVNVMTKEWQEIITNMCGELNPRLIIIDTLSRAHDLDENSNSHMSQLLSVFEQMATQTGAAILLLHHTAKSMATQGRGDEQQAVRGASALVDNARWQAFLAGMSKEEAGQYGVAEDCRKNFVRYGISKNNYAAPFSDMWFRRHEGGVLLPATLGEKKKQGRVL